MNRTLQPTHQGIVDWLVEFMAETLDIAPHEIDPTTPMDHLGIDSAAVLVICAGLREEHGAQVRPKDVFDHYTADTLARHVTATLPAGV